MRAPGVQFAVGLPLSFSPSTKISATLVLSELECVILYLSKIISLASSSKLRPEAFLMV